MGSEGEAGRPLAAPSVQLRRALAASRRRLALRRALEASSRALPWSIACAALLVALQQVLGPHSPLAPTDAQLLAAGLAIGLVPPLLAAAHAALGARLPDVGAALLLDRALGSAERATAAVALAGAPDAEAWASRALEALGPHPARAAVPFRPLPWRSAALCLGAFAGAFLLPPLPSGAADAAPARDERVMAAATTLKKEAEELAAELEDRRPAEEATRLLDEVRRSAERAALQPMSPDEAVETLQRLDQQARSEQERRQAADAGALQRALSSLEQATLKRDAARDATDSEAASLEKQLQALAERFSDGAPFESRESKRLAARLNEAADALKASHPELSEKLSELADAIERGDAARAEELARELAASPELQQLASEAATEETLEETRRIVRQAMAAMGRAPTDEELQKGEGEGEGDNPGEGQGEGDGATGKPGQRDRSGKAVVQRDWGVGTTNEAAPESALERRGLQQDRQASETSDWREAYDALHDSTTLPDARGRSSRVKGMLSQGEIVAVESRQVAQGAEAATLPSVRVPASYARANEDALAREEVPGAYKDAVRKYFTSLDAPAGSSAAPAPAPVTKETP